MVVLMSDKIIHTLVSLAFGFAVAFILWSGL